MRKVCNTRGFLVVQKWGHDEVGPVRISDARFLIESWSCCWPTHMYCDNWRTCEQLEGFSLEHMSTTTTYKQPIVLCAKFSGRAIAALGLLPRRWVIMHRHNRAEALSDDVRLTSVAYIGSKSRTEA